MFPSIQILIGSKYYCPYLSKWLRDCRQLDDKNEIIEELSDLIDLNKSLTLKIEKLY